MVTLMMTWLTSCQAVVQHGENQEDVIDAGQQDEQVVEGVPHRHWRENQDGEAVSQETDETDHNLFDRVIVMCCQNYECFKSEGYF